MQNLSDKYIVRIIRIYGAAGYGKGLIDVMPSFGAKAILRRDIVTKCIWFQNISTIYDYSRLSILRTPDLANISILRTEAHFPSHYSNKSLINPFYITNLQYSELSVLRTKFSLPPTSNTSI